MAVPRGVLYYPQPTDGFIALVTMDHITADLYLFLLNPSGTGVLRTTYLRFLCISSSRRRTVTTSHPQMLALYHSLSKDESATTLILRLDHKIAAQLSSNTHPNALPVFRRAGVIRVHETRARSPCLRVVCCKSA